MYYILPQKGLLMKQPKLFRRNFSMVVIGQIISLFGNSILRFALPLYLLRATGSSTLFGVVTACSFVPMLILSPIGGIVADRVNKRNVMVLLDFSTAGLILLFSLLLGSVNLPVLLTFALMLLYGIQSAYQPSVQASLPALVDASQLVPANAVINQVNALANLVGPAIGGVLFQAWGLMPILYVSIGCFLFSAVMEIFIHIPFERRPAQSSVGQIVRGDLRDSFHFILHQKPVIGKVILIVAVFNLFLSSFLIVGQPVIITQLLRLSNSDQLLGYAQSAMAAGGFLGGLLTGLLSRRLHPKNAYQFLLLAAVCLLPMTAALLPSTPPLAAYFLITVFSMIIMAAATLFSVQMLAFVQAETPSALVGKVISCVMTLSMCAQPIGNALYGGLFEGLSGLVWLLPLGAAVASFLVAICSRKVFSAFDTQQVG